MSLGRSGLFASWIFCAFPVVSAAFGQISLPNQLDLGTFQENEVKRIELPIQNDSDSSITFVKFEKSCSCAYIELEGNPKLPPRDRRKLHLSVNFGSLIGNYESKVGAIWETNGKQEQREISVRGKVVSPLVLNSRTADFGEIDRASDVPDISIDATKGNSPLDWDTVVVEGSIPGISAKVERLDKKWMLIFSLKPKELPLGQFRKIVRLKFRKNGTDLPGRVEVPVVGNIQGDLKAQPDSVYLGVGKPSSLTSATIKIQSKALDISTLEAKADCPDIKLQFSDSKKHENTLVLTYTTPQKSGPFAYHLFISAPNSEQRLEMAVLGMVRADKP